jgi:hypothetical protein
MCALEIPSRRVLEDTPGRVFTMLRAIGTVLPIRAALAGRGFTEEEMARGWTLVHKVCNYTTGPAAPSIDAAVRDAQAELDAWDEPNLAIIAAIMADIHPDLHDAMMENLEPAKGPRSVLVTETVLDRWDRLEQSGDVKKRDVMATMAASGYTPEERRRLREVVKVAKSGARPPEPAADPDEVHLQDLTALYRWHHKWSAIARLVITRRDYLIRLGLANRRETKSENDDTQAPGTPSAPIPA